MDIVVTIVSFAAIAVSFGFFFKVGSIFAEKLFA